MSEMPTRVEISHKTIIFSILILIGLWFLIQIKEILLLLFISLIVVSTLHSPVDFLSSKKIPRALAIFLVYLGLIFLATLISMVVIPPFIEQSQSLIQGAPQIFEQINKVIVFYQIPSEQVINEIGQTIRSLGGNVVRITTGVLTSIVGVITLFVLSFYLLLEWKKVVTLISSAFSGRQEQRIKKILNALQINLGRWMRGELALMFIVGISSYIGLTLLGVPFALPLAVLAGLFEVIPVIGPILSAIPAVLAGLLISPFMALAVAALYFVIQQVENNIVVPTVMSKAVGLNPLAALLALLVGAKLFGIWGAILSIPVLVSAKIVLVDFLGPQPDIVEEE